MTLYEIADVVINALAFGISIAAIVMSKHAMTVSKTANELSSNANEIANEANELSSNANEIANEANELSKKANEIAKDELEEIRKANMPILCLCGELGIESKSKESLMKENTFDFEDKILDCYADDQTVDCITIEIKNNGNSALEGLVIKKLYILSGKKYDLENSPDGAKKLYCGGSDKAEHFNLSQNEEAKINFPIGDIIAEEENYDDLQTAMQDIWGYTNIIVIMNVEIYSSNDTRYSKCICGEYEKGKVVRPF